MWEVASWYCWKVQGVAGGDNGSGGMVEEVEENYRGEEK